MSRAGDVLDALSSVRDPELDEPLPELGFVGDVDVEGDDVRVRLRLPTYFCAPNFAYLMVSASTRAIGEIAWVGGVEVVLEDHFSAAEINRSVAEESGFDSAFPGQVEGDVDDLVDLFARKALMVRQSRIAEGLKGGGADDARLATMLLGELPDGAEKARAVELRRRLGLAAEPDSPGFVRPDGSSVDAAELPRFLRMARLIRLSMDGNAGLCRSLLATRYGLPDHEEAPA